MTSSDPLVISGAVEGLVDEVVLRRMVELTGAILGPVYGKNGKRDLRQRLGGYNRAARFRPWIVLVDLDQDADCAPPLRAAWLPKPAPNMYFRVVVRAVEAWLLADRESLSPFLGITAAHIPREPEAALETRSAAWSIWPCTHADGTSARIWYHGLGAVARSDRLILRGSSSL